MDFNDYLKERYEPQIKWYDAKSVYNHRMFKLYQGLIIIGASSVPVLSATLDGSLRWITVIVSSLVAILIGLLNLLKYQEKWIRHRASCEKLKREKYYHLLGVLDYSNLPPEARQQKFVERVEQVIADEQIEWVREHGRRADNFENLVQ